jgi:hypothetical protein
MFEDCLDERFHKLRWVKQNVLHGSLCVTLDFTENGENRLRVGVQNQIIFDSRYVHVVVVSVVALGIFDVQNGSHGGNVELVETHVI